jgi:hypothetical protein
VLDRERPHPVEGPRLVDQEALLDVHARLAQQRPAPGGDRVGVALREDHAADAGVAERDRARPRAAGVRARLEGDHGRRTPGALPRPGQRVGLGVRAAGAAVVALGHGRAGVVEEDAADPRVGAERYAGRGGQREGALHRRLLGWCERHRRLSGLTAPGRRLVGTARVRTMPACTSHPDFDRRSRSSTWSTGHWR